METGSTTPPAENVRVINAEHFEHAFKQVSPSTRRDQELEKWDKSFHLKKEKGHVGSVHY